MLCTSPVRVSLLYYVVIMHRCMTVPVVYMPPNLRDCTLVCFTWIIARRPCSFLVFLFICVIIHSLVSSLVPIYLFSHLCFSVFLHVPVFGGSAYLFILLLFIVSLFIQCIDVSCFSVYYVMSYVLFHFLLFLCC